MKYFFNLHLMVLIMIVSFSVLKIGCSNQKKKHTENTEEHDSTANKTILKDNDQNQKEEAVVKEASPLSIQITHIDKRDSDENTDKARKSKK